jgi:hypothetical protein
MRALAKATNVVGVEARAQQPLVAGGAERGDDVVLGDSFELRGAVVDPATKRLAVFEVEREQQVRQVPFHVHQHRRNSLSQRLFDEHEQEPPSFRSRSFR